MSASFDMIVLGEYFYDLIYTGLPEFPTLGREINSADVTTTGGAMYITAVSLHRLGAKVGWPVTFGDDYYSRSVYGFALCEQLDMSLARHLETPYRRVTTALPLQGERAFVTFTDADATDLADFWLRSLQASEFKHLHIGGFDKRADMQPLIAYAHARGSTVSTDCNDGPHLQDPCACRDYLRGFDIFMPNAREAMMVTERDNVQDAVIALTELVDIVVVKDGARGSWVGQGERIIHTDSVSAGAVVDTTGAGDCYNAGFLYGYITEGAPLDVCARYGNICGGLSVTGVGGATASPTHAQLQEWLLRA